MTRPPHSSWFDHPNIIWWSLSSSLCSLLHSPVTYSLLGPNIQLRTIKKINFFRSIRKR
jgi:hypothetical protein